MTSKELYKKLSPTSEEIEFAQAVAGKVNWNTSSFFTKLIKDAARCNSYCSDVYYDMNAISEQLDNYTGDFEPMWIGFRRNGVDGTNLILARIQDDYLEVHNEYFALYSLNIIPDEGSWIKVITREYWM